MLVPTTTEIAIPFPQRPRHGSPVPPPPRIQNLTHQLIQHFLLLPSQSEQARAAESCGDPIERIGFVFEGHFFGEVQILDDIVKQRKCHFQRISPRKVQRVQTSNLQSGDRIPKRYQSQCDVPILAHENARKDAGPVLLECLWSDQDQESFSVRAFGAKKSKTCLQVSTFHLIGLANQMMICKKRI